MTPLPLPWSVWRYPDKLAVSAWAERYRELPRRQTAHPGPWRNDMSPYLVGIMDALLHPDVREITIRKAAQVGASEAIRNFIGWVADQCPDPLLLVLPTEQDAERIMAKRILPLFKTTPQLSRLLTDSPRDLKLKSVTLRNGFDLRVGWSHSASTLASDPIRFVVNDEVDKFAPWSGREADPLSLARVRTRTFGPRARIVNISTPTTQDGFISQLFDQCETQLLYHCPCPACGHWQPLTFDRLKWPKRKDNETRKHWAARVERAAEVYYLCRNCPAQWDESQRPALIRAGQWRPESGDPEWKYTPRVGFQLPVLVALWQPWSGVVAEFLRSADEPLQLMNFKNSALGEPFAEQVARTDYEVTNAADRRLGSVNTVPPWTLRLYCAADVQQDHVYYVVRAWGAEMRSQRVAHGMCRTLDELHDIAFGARYTINGLPVACHTLGIDSGYRTPEVYKLAEGDPRVKPFKGVETLFSGKYVKASLYRPGAQGRKRIRRKSILYLVDVNAVKDWLSSLITSRIPAEEPDAGQWRWLLDNEPDEEYQQHLRSEHKIVVRRGARGNPVEAWVPRTRGAANHFWDCEVYQLALAWLDNLQQARARGVAPVADAPSTASPPAARPQPARPAPTPRPVNTGGRGFRRSYG